MASWRDGGRQPTLSEDAPDGHPPLSKESTQSVTADKSSTSTSASAAGADLQKPPYMMANSHYLPFHGPLPPYMPMRPGVKPPAMGPVPFHMAHMPVMPPNYSPMMMPPFVRIFGRLFRCITNLFITAVAVCTVKAR